MKIAIFTANIGGMDMPSPHLQQAGVDVHVFTDTPELYANYPTYTIHKINPLKGRAARLMARKVKIIYPNTHPVLNKYDVLVWADANIQLKYPVANIVKKMKTDVLFVEHGRNCLYDEGEACINLGKDTKETILPQLQKYRADNVPEKMGMVATGIMIRKLTDNIKQFNLTWYNEVKNHSIRDQVSVIYALYKTGIDYDYITVNQLDTIRNYKLHAAKH
jgi:hypothetical protein